MPIGLSAEEEQLLKALWRSAAEVESKAATAKAAEASAAHATTARDEMARAQPAEARAAGDGMAMLVRLQARMRGWHARCRSDNSMQPQHNNNAIVCAHEECD